MRRVVETMVGIILLGVAGTLAIGSVTSKGAVSMEWPLAVVILTLVAAGGHLVSKSLWTSVVGDAVKAIKAWRKPD